MAASWECPSLPMIHLPMKDSSKISFLAVKPVRCEAYLSESAITMQSIVFCLADDRSSL